MNKAKHYMLIACAVISRECYYCAAVSDNIIDIRILDKDLHDMGESKMSTILQEAINAVDTEKYDAILLGYGLCNNGVRGLHSTLPLVIPRAHDCITLLLGSKEKYKKYFDENPGTYFESAGWLERGDSSTLDNNADSIPARLGIKNYDYYVKEYGEENAKYIIETLGAGIENYTKFAFIDTKVGDVETYKKQVKAKAKEKGWDYEELSGNTKIFLKMMNGDWDEDTFLVIKPGKTTEPSHKDDVIKTT